MCACRPGGVDETCRPVISGLAQSSTMPRRPARTCCCLERRSSDVSTQQADPVHNQTPVRTAIDGLNTDDSSDGRPVEESLTTTPAGFATKTFASPVAVSPANTGVLALTNTRRIGSKFCIDLVKGLSTYE